MKYKNITLFAGLVCLSFSLLAQSDNFTLKGTLNNTKNGAKIYLISYGEAKAKKDSAIIENGNFTFKGKIVSICTAQLYLPHGNNNTRMPIPLRGELDFRNLFLDAGDIILTGTDSVKTLRVKSSKINIEDENLTKLLRVIENKKKATQNKYVSASPALQKDIYFQQCLNNELENLNHNINDIKMSFAVDNPDSYVSMNAMFEVVQSRSADYYRVAAIYKLLTDKYKSTALASKTEDMISMGLSTTVGATARDFTQPDANGKQYKLSDFKGKYVLLEMWSSWCGPCRQESPNLVAAYNKYNNKNFTILAVSLDIDKAKWLEAVEKDKMPYLQVNDLKGPRSNDVAVIYGTQAIPENFLINPDGKIIAKNLRGEDLQNMLKTLFD